MSREEDKYNFRIETEHCPEFDDALKWKGNASHIESIRQQAAMRHLGCLLVLPDAEIGSKVLQEWERYDGVIEYQEEKIITTNPIFKAMRDDAFKIAIDDSSPVTIQDWLDYINASKYDGYIKEFKTRTGAIYCDTEDQLEYLYVGDYGKENNIKADFLGFTNEINSVPHHEVDLAEKMVVTISTQKGCPMNCMFCGCPKVPFSGNASLGELAEEVARAIQFSGCKYTKRFNLHLARMGEPSLNAKNVLYFLKHGLRKMVDSMMKADTIHPVFTTMCPKMRKEALRNILVEFCNIKNEDYDGEAGLQLSINSTDEKQRNELFRGNSMSLEDISEIARQLPLAKGRKYTLNFPITDKTILDPKELSRLFEKEKFIVKITPIHETNEANANGLSTEEGYYKYDVYRKFEQPLLEEGWEVIVFVPSKEEDEDRITCGNALLSFNQDWL